MKEVEKIEDLFKKLREDEENVRLLVDKPKEITQSRDEIKKIIMEQTQMEGQLDRKMAQMQARNQEEAKMMYAIERTRIMDHIYLKYKIRIVELMKAYKDFGLEKDQDVRALQHANMA